MSTEITTTGHGVVEKQQWARAMAPAPLLPKAYRDNPANLFLAAELADSLGIDRINALTSIHVVEGKPSASADLMAALVRRAGHRLRVQGNDQGARAVLIRADDPDFEYEAVWTPERARAAGLAAKDVWKKYPAAMLRSRAITEVIRAGASEVMVGVIYTPEELGADVDGSGQPTRATHITAQPVTVAELVGDQEPEPAPVDVTASVDLPADDETPGILSDHTRRTMFALLTERGITDATQQREGMTRILGREITSRADLTEDDGLAIIASLRGES